MNYQVKHFDYPVQVSFYDVGTGEYKGGIAYKDYIICGCCGGIIELEDLYEDAAAEEVVPLIEMDWLDISNELIGA